MRTFHGLQNVGSDQQGSVMTLGSFDGLHLGHRQLVREVIDKSREFHSPSVVMTFDPHPSHVLRPENPSPRLFPVGDLEAELSTMGVSILVVEPFTQALAQTSAVDFMDHIVGRIRPRCLIVGYDFAFGRSREGNWSMLQDYAKGHGFQVMRQDPLMVNGRVVSSTSIRQFLQAGEVESAAQYLGRPYYLGGAVVHGEGRGEHLGFPTLNLSTSTEIRLAAGVYVTKVRCGGVEWPSITNVGHKPTFHANSPLTVETHLLDARQNLYHQDIQVDFLKRLRSELKFPNAHALIEQIREDVSLAKKYFGI
jgi:riboflavin kinase/FMN adenylyltransferase